MVYAADAALLRTPKGTSAARFSRRGTHGEMSVDYVASPPNT